MGADALEMDTGKEKGGQGFAESELPLAHHGSSLRLVFLFRLQPPFITSHPFQIFVLCGTFSICAGIFAITAENLWRWREAEGSLRNSKVPYGSLNKLAPFLLEETQVCSL